MDGLLSKLLILSAAVYVLYLATDEQATEGMVDKYAPFAVQSKRDGKGGSLDGIQISPNIIGPSMRATKGVQAAEVADAARQRDYTSAAIIEGFKADLPESRAKTGKFFAIATRKNMAEMTAKSFPFMRTNPYQQNAAAKRGPIATTGAPQLNLMASRTRSNMDY